MKYTVIIPETLVTLETSSGTLPEGTTVLLSVPVKGLKTVPLVTPSTGAAGAADNEVPKPTPEIGFDSAQPDRDVTLSEVEGPKPTPPAKPVEVPELPTRTITPTFDRIYDPVEFRSAAKRFDVLGKAHDLGLSDSDWTIVLNVLFTDFSTEQRVIGSASVSGAGSSLQLGVQQGGLLWMDTFHGAMVGDRLELNRWYELAFSHMRNGQEKLYINKQLNRHSGNIPIFKSQDDLYVGRWGGNTFADFDLKRVRIYPLLSDEEIKEIRD
jgi:hypothetical protein